MSDEVEEFIDFNCQQVSDYVKKEVPLIGEDILERIIEHKIDGEIFSILNDECLREIAPLLGDRLKLKKLIVKVLEVDVRSLICISHKVAVFVLVKRTYPLIII